MHHWSTIGLPLTQYTIGLPLTHCALPTIGLPFDIRFTIHHGLLMTYHLKSTISIPLTYHSLVTMMSGEWYANSTPIIDSEWYVTTVSNCG